VFNQPSVDTQLITDAQAPRAPPRVQQLRNFLSFLDKESRDLDSVDARRARSNSDDGKSAFRDASTARRNEDAGTRSSSLSLMDPRL